MCIEAEKKSEELELYKENFIGACKRRVKQRPEHNEMEKNKKSINKKNCVMVVGEYKRQVKVELVRVVLSRLDILY